MLALLGFCQFPCRLPLDECELSRLPKLVKKGREEKAIKHHTAALSLGASALNPSDYVPLLWLVWMFSEAYLQWINYKGRFKYGLLEGNKFQKYLQSKIGVLSLGIAVLLKLGLILLLPLLVMATFKLSSEVAFISVVSGFIGLTLSNALFDKYSVEAFSKHCKRCDHKRECSDFLNDSCTLEFFKHRVRMAVKADEN